MIRTLFFLTIAGLLVLGALRLAEIPGDVAFNWQGWRVVVPAPILILTLVAFAAAAALLYRLWRGFSGVPAAVVAAHRRARRERGYKALTQGMVAVAAGDAGEAQRQSRRADVLLNEPPLTMLLSAQTAQLNGDHQAARRYFTAMLEREETAFLGLRGLLAQAQRDGDRAEALALAERARRLQPRTGWVLQTLYDLQVAEKDWDAAEAALTGLTKARVISADAAARRRAALSLLRAREAKKRLDTRALESETRDALKQAPDWLPAIIAAAGAMVEAGKHRNAEKLVAKHWKTHPHFALAEIFRRARPDDDPLTLVQKVEKLVAENADHPESQLALARAMLDASLWGGARSHLEAAAKSGETPEICRLMARLEEGEHGDIDAANKWLRRATDAPPGPAWACAECGGRFSAFTPDCQGCGALGSLDWDMAAPDALALSGPAAGVDEPVSPAVLAAPPQDPAGRPADEKPNSGGAGA